MATNVNVIYERALSKMREYTFVDMDDDEVFDVLSAFLEGAESEFERIYGRPLSRDNGEYAFDLTPAEIEILALGVVCYWTTAYVADADKWMNALGTKDYSVFSPANLLNVTSATRDNLLLEFHDKMNRYSYIHGDLIRDAVR